jgi:hypothetical protein
MGQRCMTRSKQFPFTQGDDAVGQCLWMAMVTAQLVEMVLDPNYKLPSGEAKLYHWKLMYIYKVLLDTVLESSLRAILHQGDDDTVPKMWEWRDGTQGRVIHWGQTLLHKDLWLPQYCYNYWWYVERSQQGLHYPLVWAAPSVGRNDMDEGWTLKESHTYEKHFT